MGIFNRREEPKEVKVKVDRDGFKAGDTAQAHAIWVDEQIVEVTKHNGNKAYFSTEEVESVDED